MDEVVLESQNEISITENYKTNNQNEKIREDINHFYFEKCEEQTIDDNNISIELEEYEKPTIVESKFVDLGDSSGSEESDNEVEPTSFFNIRRKLNKMVSPKKKTDEDVPSQRILINDAKGNAKIRKPPSNYIRTTKYTLLSFIPKNLFEQLRRVSNLYFIITMIITLIPTISPIFPLTSIFPVVVILGLTALKDGIEDFARYRADKVTNGRPHWVLRDGIFKLVPVKDITVGDIVRVMKDDEIPADMVILSTSIKQERICYVETSNLDGETNLKIRRSVPVTAERDSPEQLAELKGELVVEEPNEHLHQFRGYLNLTPENEKTKIPLNSENLLIRGEILRNTKMAHAVVVYVGKDTKLFKNLKSTKSKFSGLDKKLNRLLFILLFGQQIVCATMVVLSAWFQNEVGLSSFYISPVLPNPADFQFIVSNYLTYFILLNLVIPMSLFVTLEFIKSFQAKNMELDPNMMHNGKTMKAKSSNLNEELAHIEYVFTDKTGTLTENLMTFKKCFVANRHHDESENPGGLQELLESHGKIGLDTKEAITEFLLCLSLNHSVIPEYSDDTKLVIYEGQSPDEVALLKAARANGFSLLHRTNTGMQVEVYDFISEKKEKRFFEVLCTLDFTSDRKMMSIIVKTEDGRIVLYSKGADNVMLSKSTNVNDLIRPTKLAVHKYSCEGLRTLVICKRELTKQEFDSWYKKYKKAATSLSKREELVAKVASEIENHFVVLGCTAIEDRLQDGVPEAINYLLRAGLQVWVLTGDKSETALMTAYSANVIDRERTHIISIKKGKSKHLPKKEAQKKKKLRIRRKLRKALEIVKADKNGTEFALLMDGHALKYALQYFHKEMSQLCTYCNSVVCSRVTPLQKALVVKIVEKTFKKHGVAIGDGANDVSMIQAATVGVGIIGREGSQAARASDYAIHRFKHITRLLAIHGRYSYVRNSDFLHLSFYKNMVIVYGLLFYCIFNGFTGQTLYDSWVMTLLNIVFTTLPPFVSGIYEKDVREEVLEEHPELYKSLKTSGRLFSAKTVFLFFLTALYHAAVIFFFMYFCDQSGLFEDGSMGGLWEFSTYCMTSSIIVIVLRTALEVKHWTLVFHVTLWAGVLAYIAFHFAYGVFPLFLGYGNMYYVTYTLITSYKFYIIQLLVVVACLIPDLTFKFIQRHYFPADWEILRKENVMEINKRKRELKKLKKNEKSNEGVQIKQSIETERQLHKKKYP